MPRTFVYRCLNTGQNVQGWSADGVTDDGDTYQSFPCIACSRVHLVNLKTGKVLGERLAQSECECDSDRKQNAHRNH